MHIARLLIEHGATVDDSVLQDHRIDMAGGPHDWPLYRILKAASKRGSSG